MIALGRKITARIVLLFALRSTINGTVAADTRQGMETEIDIFMAYLMKNLDVVPGYSIAVVTPDSTIVAKGYGTTAEPVGRSPHGRGNGLDHGKRFRIAQ